MVALDRDARPSGEADALDDVGIERALREEIGAADLLGLGLEQIDEGAADELALLFGIGLARETAEEHLLRVHMDQWNVVMVAEQRDDLLGLVHPHQPVVDEDAGQLVADRLVDQHRGDRAVDTAGQAADDLAVADLRANFLDFGLAEFGHGPVAREAADMAHEIGEQLAAVGRMDDLGVELRAVIAALVVGDQREGCTRAGGDDAETVGELRDLVAMAHPHLVRFARLPEAVEQHAFLGDFAIGAAEFAALAGLVTRANLAAELLRHDLLAVADAEDRHTAVEDHVGSARGSFVGDAGRTTREDYPLGLEPVEGLFRLGERGDFRVHAGFAHATRDELGDLAAEIDDEDGIGEVLWLHGVR